jgi:hypothetical protein
VLSKIPPKQKKALQEAQASKSSASLVKLSSIGSLVGPHGYNVIGHDHAGLYEGNLPPPAALKAALMPVYSNSSDGPPVAKALSNVLEYVSPLALYGAPLCDGGPPKVWFGFVSTSTHQILFQSAHH